MVIADLVARYRCRFCATPSAHLTLLSLQFFSLLLAPFAKVEPFACVHPYVTYIYTYYLCHYVTYIHRYIYATFTNIYQPAPNSETDQSKLTSPIMSQHVSGKRYGSTSELCPEKEVISPTPTTLKFRWDDRSYFPYGACNHIEPPVIYMVK